MKTFAYFVETMDKHSYLISMIDEWASLLVDETGETRAEDSRSQDYMQQIVSEFDNLDKISKYEFLSALDSHTKAQYEKAIRLPAFTKGTKRNDSEAELSRMRLIGQLRHILLKRTK